MAINPIIKFLNAARSLANQGMSKEAIEQFARNEFGEITELFQKQINNIFRPKKGIENIKIKDEVFDDTVVELPYDDQLQPFNPKNPLKQYGTPKQNRPDVFGIDDYDTTNMSEIKKQVIRTETKLGNLNPDAPDFQERAKILIDELDDLKVKMKNDKPRTDKYTGGMVEVEPNLSDIGHGSDALMARTRLVAPNSQATTSTGLNYLLPEDNDNIRVPFSKGKLADAARRKFMKTAGGITAGIGALKAGLINLGKEAAPVAETAVEAAKGVPPYFFQLVDVIKSKGREIRSYGDRVRQYIAPSKDGKSELMLTEDLSTGDVQVKKIYKEGDDMVTKSEEMNFTKGRGDESTQGTPADDYEEITEYNSRIYKDEFNDPDVVEGIDIDEIVKEIDVKKADGGRIGFSKGKLVFENAAKFLNKVFGKENMAEMPNRDPEMYQGILEVVDMFRNRDKEGLIKYMRKFLPHKNDAEIEEFIIGSDGTEGIQGELIRLGSGRDYKSKIDMIKEAGEKRKLSDLEVTEEMIRKPNASGGLANLLGE